MHIFNNLYISTTYLFNFRYAVKLAIDECIEGEVSDNTELQEKMEEYERDWYIGSEKDEEWGQAILASKPNLISLSHEPLQVGIHTTLE